MKFSIIIPTYNSKEWIQQCIDSVLAQSYNEFDLIILDSGSTDDTVDWISHIKDDRIRIYTTDKRLSIEENWEKMMQVPRNEFMTILGHDDVLYPDFLQVINKLIIEHPSASLYHTHFDLIDAAGKTIRHTKPMQSNYTGPDLLKALLTHSINAMATGYVIRSKDYDRVGGVPVRYPNLMFADYELWLKLTYLGHEVVAPENCFAFRVHQSTTNTTQDKKLHTAMEIFVYFLLELKQQDVVSNKMVNEYGAQFLLRNCQSYSHRLLRTPLEERGGSTVVAFIQQTKELARILGVEKQYHPEKLLSIRLAAMIDNNVLLRKLFLLFKKIYSRPISG
jgi:glycosyltransferase involved in cell wall biosynthesis